MQALSEIRASSAAFFGTGSHLVSATLRLLAGAAQPASFPDDGGGPLRLGGPLWPGVAPVPDPPLGRLAAAVRSPQSVEHLIKHALFGRGCPSDRKYWQSPRISASSGRSSSQKAEVQLCGGGRQAWAEV